MTAVVKEANEPVPTPAVEEVKRMNRQYFNVQGRQPLSLEEATGLQTSTVTVNVEGTGRSPSGPPGEQGVDGSNRLEDHPDIAKALAEGFTLKQCENGRHVARRMAMKIQAAQRRHGPRSDEAQAAIDEANRVSVMLTTARAAYNRITYPERYT